MPMILATKPTDAGVENVNDSLPCSTFSGSIIDLVDVAGFCILLKPPPLGGGVSRNDFKSRNHAVVKFHAVAKLCDSVCGK